MLVDNKIKNLVYLISMGKKLKSASKERAPQKKGMPAETPIGFRRGNYIIFGTALATILLGFLFLTSPVFGGGFPFVHPFKGGTYDWLTMNVAPILLVLGYCVLLPWAIVRN